MKHALGVVVDHSLRDIEFVGELPVIAKRQAGTWGILLISVAEGGLDAMIQSLQKHMVSIAEDCWYAHFFGNGRLTVVYQDAVFAVSDGESTMAAVQYGNDHGVPLEQLDFYPRTQAQAEAYFGLVDGALKD
ncbi:MAG: hypothetical protein M1272_04255 [Firmicutes bacterium]|nr:hypothetical protein [Bacillota bacterium]